MARQQNNNNVPLTRRPQSGALVGRLHGVRHLAVETLLRLEIRAYLIEEHLQHFCSMYSKLTELSKRHTSTHSITHHTEESSMHIAP